MEENMKIYISADIEGITGTTNWDETEKKHPDYPEFRDQMTAEVAAACEGALAAGATEIMVKDAHDSARNIQAEKLPKGSLLWRGWSGHPYMMVDGMDSSYAAVLMIGYHSRAGSHTNPLSHSMSGSDVYIKINDIYASEFLINAYAAALSGVPVAFVSGDAGLCKEVQGINPAVITVAVKEGIGNSTINIHPQLAVEQIRSGVEQALKGDLKQYLIKLPEKFSVDIRFKDHTKAYSSSFYPGVSLPEPYTIHFETKDYFEVLRMFAFVF
jgi:D-amino peptidase